MIRKSLTILSLIGLVLSVGLWGVSFKWGVGYVCNPRIGFGFVAGRLFISGIFGELTGSYRGHGKNGIKVLDASKERFQWTPRYVRHRNGNYHTRDVSIPLWIPTLLFALSLYFCHPLYYYRRRKRKKLGLCMKCGYDLRGSQDRCPECGEAFELPELKADR